MKKILSLALTLIAFNAYTQVYVPNAFTPDNDGRNDVFKAYTADTLDSFNLQIFNKDGDMVFETDDINQGWMGGVYYYAPVDIYTYKLMYRKRNNRGTEIIYGTVKLLR